jgi:hypothetical protein
MTKRITADHIMNENMPARMISRLNSLNSNDLHPYHSEPQAIHGNRMSRPVQVR